MDQKDIEIIKILQEDYRLSLETQRHFNEINIKFRTTAFTIIAVFTSAGIGLYKEYFIIAIATLFLSIALLQTFRYLDVNYYLQLLLGAVEKTNDTDKQFQNDSLKLFDNNYQIFGLSEYITKHVQKTLKPKDDNWDGSRRAINKTYYIISLLILLICIAMFVSKFCYKL